jgi:hypothetical protein
MSTRQAFLLVAAVSLTLLLAGCQKPGAENPPGAADFSRESTPTGTEFTPTTFGVSTLVAAFHDAGLEATIRPSGGANLLGPEADDYSLSVGTRGVTVFVFADDSMARKAASRLSEDDPFPLVEFKGRIHLYARGRVIVLFVETRGRSVDQPWDEQDERVSEILEAVMGAQIAGG